LPNDLGLLEDFLSETRAAQFLSKTLAALSSDIIESLGLQCLAAADADLEAELLCLLRLEEGTMSDADTWVSVLASSCGGEGAHLGR